MEHARAVFQLEMELLRPCLPHARCFAPPSSPSAPQLATCANDFDTCLVKRSESLASPGYPRSNPNPNPNPDPNPYPNPNSYPIPNPNPIPDPNPNPNPNPNPIQLGSKRSSRLCTRRSVESIIIGV